MKHFTLSDALIPNTIYGCGDVLDGGYKVEDDPALLKLTNCSKPIQTLL